MKRNRFPKMILFGKTIRVLLLAVLIAGGISCARTPRLVRIADGWARTSVNATIFRKNSVTTYQNQQYVAYYDPDSYLVLARRTHGSSDWEIVRTPYRGNTLDAHNSISLAMDGAGYLHLSWDHHGHPLRYCRSVAPGSLQLTDRLPMTGLKENHVTYPEFYNLPDGNLLFVYRDGGSGNGNLMMNHYDTKTRQWSRLQDTLVDGEGQRNAYWQLTIDLRGAIHLSWVWRETGDVATNHDLCYARSLDGGQSWQRSDGTPYALPITVSSAECACRIPQKSDLMNQTSMAADALGRPYIVNYWRAENSNVPQYHLVYHDGAQWKVSQISKRTTPFSLAGGGTLAVPISRPQIAIDRKGKKARAMMLFRDAEREDRVSVALCKDLASPSWRMKDLTEESFGRWEPSFDAALWQREGLLHVLAQRVGQVSGERAEDQMPPQPVYILEWKP